MKWIPKEELKNMASENLRDEKSIKRILEILETNKVFPLNVIEIF